MMGENRNPLRRTYLSASFPTTKPTRIALGLRPVVWDKISAAGHLRYGTAWKVPGQLNLAVVEYLWVLSLYYTRGTQKTLKNQTGRPLKRHVEVVILKSLQNLTLCVKYEKNYCIKHILYGKRRKNEKFHPPQIIYLPRIDISFAFNSISFFKFDVRGFHIKILYALLVCSHSFRYSISSS